MCSITASGDASPQRRVKSVENRITVSPLILGSIVALVVALLWRAIPSTPYFVAAVGLLFAGIFGFLASVILFVHFYTSSTLRKASTTAGHLATLMNNVPPSDTEINDLDKMITPEGLSNVWKQEVQDQEQTFRVLLTGVTGYVGRAFLFQLLREIANAEEEGGKKLPHKIYVMARGKARKNLSASDRLETIRDEPMFAPYKQQWNNCVLAAESGDLQEENCGMSSETIEMLSKAQITHVVHCAADVNFNRPLPDSAGINISPALQLQALSKKWNSCKRFVHCSTAFVNPGTGKNDDPMKEELFSLGDYDPQDLYDSMRSDQTLALKVKEEFGFPNNYVLTKCVAEKLVARHHDYENMELRIVRPGIVGPSWLLPHPGWNGDKPSTITGVYLLWGTRVIRFASLIKKPLPVIPVDVVAASTIHAMIAPAAKKDESGKIPMSIRNLVFSHKSRNQFTQGIYQAKSSIQLAMLLRHFSGTEAALSFFLLDTCALVPQLFEVLHGIFNLGPLYLLQFICWSLRMLGIKSVLDRVPVVKLFRFSDMLTLYKPYMGREYFFQSSLDIPDSFSNDRYIAGMIKATQGFWSKMFPGTIEEMDELDLLPKSSLDVWYSLTQPCKDFRTRIVGLLACKILRASCNSLELDFKTTEQLFYKVDKLDKTMKTRKHCVILAPTHRSAMDYVLIKYITFNMSMGMDVPLVLAKPEFEDPKLTTNLSRRKKRYDRHISLAAFLEGSPSLDGSVQKPRVEALQKIMEMDGDHDYTIIPMTMNHQGSNDSEVILQATEKRSDLGLLSMLSLYWKVCIQKQTKPSFLGDVTVSFGVPSTFEASADPNEVAKYWHSEASRVSKDAAAKN